MIWDSLGHSLGEAVQDIKILVVSCWCDLEAYFNLDKVTERMQSYFLRQTVLVQITTVVAFALFAFFLGIFLYCKLTKRSCKSKVRLDGKTALVTGANSGRSQWLETIQKLKSVCLDKESGLKLRGILPREGPR